MGQRQFKRRERKIKNLSDALPDGLMRAVMKIPRLAALSLLVLSSFAATGVAPTKTELESMYDKAFREFDANHYDEALKALDAIDARQPDLAESENLRGVVLMRKGEYDKAEKALRKALEIEPKFWNASFNLAEIPFLKKDWTEARNRFEALVAGNSDEMKGETSLLIQYKILLTFILQGRENMVDWIMNKFEGEKDSPALYYSNAALALKHDNQKEAKEWMDAAEKHYPASLNKLFAESFYEIGWLKKPEGETRAAIEITSTAERAARMKADAQANFERAERAFQQRDFPATLKFLDLADEGAPNQAASYNLRGEVFMEEKKFDQAEESFRKAYTADPKFREAQYNLAQIPFKKKDYAQSRARLEALFGETPGGEKNQAAQLIKYKIFMTLLLEGNNSQAQKMMDQFKFTGDTPALYYAQAAWAFKHNNPDQGNDWIKSARKIYSPALNIVFADSFYDLGWLPRAPETAPPTGALAQANASPPAGPAPEMRLGAAESVPPPVSNPQAQTSKAAPSPVAGASVAPAQVNAQPLAATTPATVAANKNATSAQPAASAPPVVAKAARKKIAAPAAKPSATPLVTSAAVTPAATALAPARIREWSQPTFAELTDRIAEPRMLLIGGLLLAGIVILGWLVVQQVRRHTPGTSLYQSPLPLTQPRFAGPQGPLGSDERRLSRENLEAGPPKLSLQLKASEPAVRRAVLPSGAITARENNGEVAEPVLSSPNDREESVSEVRPIVAAVPAAAAVSPPVEKIPEPARIIPPVEAKRPVFTRPPRDEKEVSLAAAPKARAFPFFRPGKTISPPAPPPMVPQEEPVAQGPPIPQLTSEPAETPSQPVMAELTTPEIAAEPAPVPAAPEAPPAESATPAQSAIETPSFASKIITTKPTTPPLTTPVIMPEPTPITALNQPRPAAAASGAQAAPAAPSATPSAAMQTAVQLTFSLEIASLQLTPNFKMGSLQVRPISKIVSMRLAPSAQPQPAMNLQVTFELSSVQLGAGASLGTVRLTPSSAQRPAAITSPSFEIAGLQLVSSSAASPVQLTPTQQGQASVLMTASFQIATVEFSPSFEIASVVLNCSSKNVAVQLPGTGPSSIEGAPVFEIGNVSLGGNNELAMVQLNPLGGRRG